VETKDLTVDEIIAETHKLDVSENPAVQVARENQPDNKQEWHNFSTGYRGRIKTVSPSLIDFVVNKVEAPKVPTWHNEERDRDEPNPSDPNYIESMEKYSRDRGIAAMDAIIMFGVELEKSLPESDEWVTLLSMLGITVNVNDKLTKEFAFKRYIAVGQPELNEAMESFQGDRGVASATAAFRR
jgi:hypothetical protein